MNYATIRPFDFSRNGRANRRDADALPRVLFVGVDTESFELHFHRAGVGHVEAWPLVALTIDDPLIDGMDSRDAWQVGAWCEQALAAWRQAEGAA